MTAFLKYNPKLFAHTTLQKFKQDLLADGDKNYAQIAKEWYRIQPYFCKGKMFWIWDEERQTYEMTDEERLVTYLDEFHNRADFSKPNKRKELINNLRLVGINHVPKNIPSRWIVFKNGIYDLDKNQIYSKTYDYFITHTIPHNFIRDAVSFDEYVDNNEVVEKPCVFDELFEQWVGKENVDLLYEIAGYCMLPDMPLNRIFFLLGSGSNGKSTFLNILTELIGQDNCCSTDLTTLMNSRFELSRLHKKLVCTMGETDFKALDRTSVLKKIVGNENIGLEFKFGGTFEDKLYAKLIIATNSLPETHDRTHGFYRRQVILDFIGRFTEQKDVMASLTHSDYESFARKALNALRRVLVNRQFTGEGDTEEKMQRYEDRSNPLPRFIREHTVNDPEGEIPKYAFRDNFNAWLKENGYRTLSDEEIGIKMKKQGFEDKRSSDESRWRVWLGLRWKEKIFDYSTVYTTLSRVSNLSKQKKEYNNSSLDAGVQGVQGVQGINPLPESRNHRKRLANNPGHGHSDELVRGVTWTEILTTIRGQNFDTNTLLNYGMKEEEVVDFIAENLLKGNIIQIKPDIFRTLE